MGKGRGGWATHLALAALLAGAVGVVQAATQQEVEESLTCQCGCGLTVHSCNHLQCGSGDPIKKEIAERLARGEDKDTILTAFRTRYGEKVLSAPTFRGFNWLAWITPFAAVLLAGGTLAYRLAGRRGGVGALPGAPTGKPTDAGRSRIEQALAEFDRDA